MQKQNRRGQRQARSSQAMGNAVSLLQQKQNSSPQAAKIDLYNNLKSGLEEKPRGWQAFASGALDGLGYSEKLNLSKEMTEKLNYLEDLNNSVLEQEDFYSKKEFAENKYKPDVLQYMENSAKMAPSDKMLMIQGILNGYNEIRGTDYVPLSIDGFDNNRITVESKKFGGTKVLNLRDEFAGDELINERFAAKMPENILAMQQERADKEREFKQKDRGLDIQEKNSDAYAVGQSAKSGANQRGGENEFDGIPLARLKGQGAAPLIKKGVSQMKLAEEAPQIFGMLNDAKKIIKAHPKLGTGWANLVGSNSVTRSALGKDDAEAYEIVDKISNRVAEAYIRAKGSDISEGERETIKKGLFDVSQREGSKKYNIDSVTKELQRSYLQGKFTADQLTHGFAATPQGFEKYLKANPNLLDEVAQEFDLPRQEKKGGTMFKIRTPDGSMFTIAESDLDAAIANGAEVIN